MAGTVQLTAPNGVSFPLSTGLFINNEFVPAKAGGTIETVNPYDESVITKVAAAEQEDIDAAVKAARAAFRSADWRGLTPAERGYLLWKLADLCERDKDILATIDSWDNGKPYSLASGEDVPETIAVLKYYAGFADKVFGRTIDVGSDKLAYTVNEPIGVCGQIIPWNYPLMMAAWKIAPALACGNTVILKPAEQTPLSALYLAKLVQEAGFPPGVLNVVNGHGRTAGAALAAHLGVDKIAFTGSTVTAKAIMRAAANNLKNITLETGGKSPLMVFEDANLDQAIKWSHVGIMSNMGQVCTSTSRIYVHESIYQKFLAEFKEFTLKTSVVGNQFDPNVNHGPQVSKIQHEKILQYVEAAQADGAKLILGGVKGKGSGYFIEPTIFADATNDMRAVREEIFGPFVMIQPFKTEEEVIEKANDTDYGLSAAVFTQDSVRAHRVASQIHAGTVWINSSQDSHIGIPFGGYKQSGIGRELGESALAAYTQVKAVHVNLGTWL
ncbi:hypothetical protein B0A52_01357 [Exophiala mesophila]|uniref:Aldehyde dehydrogenase domain-containing protein n=1 Tax=Exophiala mesophila TaxID=212818 RepID=A0A438NH88_EXOME|nr:hypothetical protein B0A52_01357 [Exophiala mesophila]